MSQAGPLESGGSIGPDVPTSFPTNDGTAVPELNTLYILGTYVSSTGDPVFTTGATDVVTINVQAANAHSSSVATNMGLASFNSADFTVDSNGFVTLAGSSALTFDADSGSATPSSNTITISGGSTGITTIASGSTLSLTGTLDVASGGTSATSFVSYAPICGGTSSTNILQSASTGLSTPGYVLVTNGNAALPSFQSVSAAGAVIGLDGDTGVANPTALGYMLISGGSTGLTTTAATSAVTLTGILNLANGGTSADLTASNGGIFYSTASKGAILSGTATANQMLQSGASTTPAWSTTTWPATSTINQLLYSSSANVIAGLATADNGVLTTGTSGIPAITALSSNGQLIIGSGAGAPAAATLTAGTGISITNGANSISIATTGTTILTVTSLSYSSSPYTVLSSDAFIAITGSTGTFTVKLPNAPSTGRVIIIKDTNGSAATYNIAVTTVGGSVTIDGSTTYTMATNYQSISVIFDGTNYEVF